MGDRNTTHGRRWPPLDPEQLERFEAAAEESEDELTRLTALTLSNTGLQTGEFCHLRPSWLKEDAPDGTMLVRVPDREECISGEAAVGQYSVRSPQEGSAACHNCRAQGEGYWTPKSEDRVRAIPLVREDVQEALVEWFTTHEQIPLLHNAVSKRVKAVADTAGLAREVRPLDLRQAYAARLLHRGMSRRTVREVLGDR